FHPWEEKNWNESISYIKDGITRYSSWLGDYPYSIATAVSGDENEVSGGMEYPTITLITLAEGGQELDITIVHELGHNWFYGVLASNERKHAWLDEGMNTYYQNRYEKEKYGNYSLVETTAGMLSRNKTPDDALESLLHAMFRMYRDQPIETPADEFSFSNYGMIVYMKASIWMKKLEDELGTPMFDSVMRAYFREWGFRHPYPEDFKNTVEKHSGKSIEPLYNLLFKTGPLSIPQKKSPKLNAFFPLNGTTRHQFISVLPALGVNMYDKLMLGAMVHNYQLALSRVRFMAAPLYATGSKKLNGIGQLSFHQYSPGKINEWSLGINGATFSTNQGVDSNGAKVFSGVSRLVPAFRLHLKNRDYRSLAHTWLDLKSFIITEQGFNYVVKQSEGISYPEEGARKTRYVNQLSLNSENHRALYPYRYQLQLQQGKEFLRAAATLHYFFNYAVGGGMNMRVAAVKFGYIGGKTPAKEANTLNYQPKLTAVRGNEDYTYSNYFVGRNEFEGAASQQIMERDGNLKIRTDIFQDLQGRSDDWIAAVNLSTTIPKKLLPIPVPLKVFADAGTYADAWKKEASVSRFLYVAGLQLSLFHDLLNVYAPLIYSREFSNSLKTVPEENKLLRKISFSINIQNFSLRKIAPDLPL
ncbi:MAG: hypothetical protein K0Q66_1239, partial [Chitinophagaceae bacterium]|nr:hypothetical protein [Chitinophagaceae bacterium]